jgi:hypothetical protein
MDNPRMEDLATAREQRVFKELTFGGSTSVMLGGAGAGVLAILGLAGVAPTYLVATSAIVLGVAMLFEGGFVVAEYGKDPERRLQRRPRAVVLRLTGRVARVARPGRRIRGRR